MLNAVIRREEVGSLHAALVLVDLVTQKHVDRRRFNFSSPFSYQLARQRVKSTARERGYTVVDDTSWFEEPVR